MLLALSAGVAAVVAVLLRPDSAIGWVGVVGGVLGPPGLWLAWASYRDDREDAAVELSLEQVADQLAVAVRDQWRAEVKRSRLDDPHPLPVQRRLALLRRYLTDDAAPVTSRATACLLLLYAQPLSRILRLTTDDLATVDGELQLRLGDPPSPVPVPFAGLLHQLFAASARSGTSLLFPGRLPGQPISYRTLNRRLRELGFPLIEARVSALRQLVLQAPAPVIADALGHQTTTARQVVHAGATWSRYAPW